MTELRRRKIGKDQHLQKQQHPHATHLKHVAERRLQKILCWANTVAGLIVAMVIAIRYARYIGELHENDMWFSNIKPVEREISFRTEAGLYFSYYKSLVLSPSLMEGMGNLMNDNKTEHGRTINILNRFNIFQEVLLATVYNSLHLEVYIEYVYFYINSVFSLHGMYMIALYCISWMISGSWITGALSAAFFILNKTDTTRVYFTIPLRESFSLPFIYIQLAAITLYLKIDISVALQKLGLIVTMLGTFFALLTWQFAQFVLLLEAFALVGLFCLDMVGKRKITNILLIYVGAMMLVCVMQFINDMLLASLCLHFCLASIVILLFAPEVGRCQGVFQKVFQKCIIIAAIFALTIVFNIGIKKMINVDSDEHIFKFLMAKIGYGEALRRDFDSLLYLCEGAFRHLPFDTISRLTDGLVFPCYVIAVLMSLVMLISSVVILWRSGNCDAHPWMLQNHPEIAFTVIQTVFFALMAVSTLRMKYLWTPHICVVAAGLFCRHNVWHWIFGRLKIKEKMANVLGFLVPVIVLALLLWRKLPSAVEELKILREFYDPDTVELMQWIKSNTRHNDAFTGSMQLMAGVKLCTDRPITNHPHYENKFLRQRTREVYQIYAKKSAKDVYDILKQHGTNYIILENSICYSRQENGCRLIDIIDIDNGHELLGSSAEMETRHTPRFCHAIKYDGSFMRYFRKVFENRTFYIYKLK